MVCDFPVAERINAQNTPSDRWPAGDVSLDLIFHSFYYSEMVESISTFRGVPWIHDAPGA